MSTAYLSMADVVALHDDLLARYGGAAGLRDEGLLESAVTRPQMAAYYEGSDLVRQAATLIAGVAYNHPFVDGNKRTALVAGYLFLRANGTRIAAEPLEAAQAVLAALTVGTIDRAVADLDVWLRVHAAMIGDT